MNHPWFGETPFLTTSAFSTMAFLDRWARGEGGHWRDWVEHFIERRQRQGIQAIRVFDETTYWNDRDDNATNDHRFFNEDRATSLRMWDYGSLRIQARPHHLTAHHQSMLLELIRLARKHDMKVELVVDATLKHSPSVGWLVIGHCIRQVADFLKGVHRETWVDIGQHLEGGMGSREDAAAHERIRAAFERVKGPLHELVAVETHNEWDAHSQASWRDAFGDELQPTALREKALGEVDQQLSRMKTESHWPESASWVSHGGRDGQGTDPIEYDWRRADAIALHPARPSMNVGSRFDALLRHGKPVYANEILHYIDPEYWFTVDQGWFRPGSSTKDTEARRRFETEMLDKGMWVCDHSLVGMANGMWRRGGWEVMPLDGLERARLGDGGGVEPPPPTRMRRYESVIAQAYEDILERLPDENGLDNYNELMKAGMSEANVREQLIRSPEFEAKNPETT